MELNVVNVKASRAKTLVFPEDELNKVLNVVRNLDADERVEIAYTELETLVTPEIAEAIGDRNGLDVFIGDLRTVFAKDAWKLSTRKTDTALRVGGKYVG